MPAITVVSGVYKSTIVRDAEYALREKREAPIQRVRILEHVRGNRWKAQWIDPNSGLVHYVESGHLLCPWKQLKAFLREESDADRLRQHNVECGWVKDSPVDQALYQVFENVGDDVSYYRGVLTSKPEPLARVKTRAGMPVDKSSPYAYTDRAGTIHIPFDEAVEIARRFCAAEPAVILASIEATEQDWAREAALPGEKHMVSLLNEFRASWALLRQWAGQDAAIARRDTEIQRLERLVWDAVYALQKAGLDKESARLRRAIERSTS